MENIAEISHCRITKSSILLNGKTVFQTEEEQHSISDFFKTAYRNLEMDYKKFFKMDTLSQAAILGTEYLINSTDFNNKYASDEVGILFGNRSSSLTTDVNYYNTISSFPSPGLFVYTLPNITIGEVAIKHKISGENAFFVLDHYDDDVFEQYVDILMDNESLKCCIAGWIEITDEEMDVHFTLVEKQTDTS